eukprot:3604478-Rhodomonas_salina.1
MHRRSFATSVRVTPRSPVVAPEECGDTQEQWHRLVQWVSARGGWIHPGRRLPCGLRACASVLRGVCCVEDAC